MKAIMKSYLGVSILNLWKDREVWGQDSKLEIGLFDGMKKKACSLQQGQVSHSKHNEMKDQKTKEIPNQMVLLITDWPAIFWYL